MSGKIAGPGIMDGRAGDAKMKGKEGKRQHLAELLDLA
jgi:hypothetical protein